jgi:hypothetical protein
MMVRKPISSTVLGAMLFVVCDDGSVWEMDPGGRWVERSPLPGTQAEIRVEAERRVAAS